MSLKLLLLGTPRVEVDGVVVSGKAVQRRRLAILALLALSPRRTLSRERIVFYLWPDHAPDAARRLLSESVYVLRRQFGDATIEASGDDLTLSSAFGCDVDDFLAAVLAGNADAALTAYGGRLMDVWFIKETPDFEDWLEGQRGRLAAMHSRLVRQLAESAESEGDWSRAAEWWQTLVRLDPYSTPSAIAAARALASSGERASALQLLAAHEERLRTELGADPDTELTDLAHQIRQGGFLRRRSAVPALANEDPKPNAPANRTLAPQVDAGSVGDGTVTRDAQSSGSKRRRPLLFAACMVAIAGIVIAPIGWRAAGRMFGETRGVSDALERRRIAVAYFQDQSPDQSLGYLADGLTEYLIDELSLAPGLRVVSSSAIRKFKEAPDDSLMRRFGVRTVVRATIEQANGVVRVRARIIDPKSGEQVGAASADGKAGQTFELNDAISQRLAAELRRWIGDGVSIARAREGIRHGGSNAALDLVLRARRLRREAEDIRVGAGPSSSVGRDGRLAVRKADSILAVAEDLDRSWAVPAIERGWMALQDGMLQNGANRVLSMSPGLAHAERAITLIESQPRPDSTLLAQALYLRGLLRVRSATAVYTFRPESVLIRNGEDDLLRAVRIDTTLAGAWAALALPRWIHGDFPGVGEAAARAMAADAYLEEGPAVIGWAWRAAYERGQKREAMHWCERGRREYPSDWHFLECELIIMRLDVARLSGDSPDTARAWALVRELDAVDPATKAQSAGHTYSPIVRRMIAAMVSAAAGDMARARGTLAAAQAQVLPEEEFRTDLLYESACLKFVMGEHAEGERLLGEYLQARPDVAGFIARDTVVNVLRRR